MAKSRGAALPDLQGVTILVVEDHRDSRDAMRQFLEYHHARVLLAREGQEALELLRTEAPDVILCDLKMPGMDGLEFMRRVRADERTRSLRVIALSGLGGQGDLNHTWTAGFEGHLVKPVDQELLIATLERTLWVRFPTSSGAAPRANERSAALTRAHRAERGRRRR